MEPLLIALSSVSPVLAGLLIALKLRLGKVNKLVVQQQEVIEKYTAEVNKAELVINRSLEELDSKELINPINNIYSPVASELLAGYFKSAYRGGTMANNGYVYIVRLDLNDREKVNNLYKVGQTRKKDYTQRFKELKNKYNADVEPAFVVFTNDVDRLEAQTMKLLMPYQATVATVGAGFPPLGDECFVADVELIKDAIFTASKSNEITIETVFGY
jgi:hypothetical protein